MKKITKRITALIIAAILIATMIPTAFATTEEGTVKEKYEFIFTSKSHGSSGSKNLFSSEIFTVNQTAAGFDKWGFVTAWNAQTRNAYDNRLQYAYKYTSTKSGGYVYNPDESKYPAFLALEIVIDQPGTYTPSLAWTANGCSPYVDLYLIKAPTEEAEVAAWKDTSYEIASKEKCYGKLSGVAPIGRVGMQLADDNGDKSGEVKFSTVTIADGAEGSYYLVFVPNGATEAAKAAMDATVDDKGKNTYSCQMTLNSFSLTRITDDPITEAFEVTETPDYSYVAPTAIGVAKDGTVIETEDNEDGTFDLTAAEINSKNEKFLYWALGLTGNKRIVSFGRTLENYMPAEDGRNYLIAVYEGDVDTSKVEYYNQNGQLIPDATENETVSMPGYGSTSKWIKHSDNIYVADYEKTEDDRDNVTVTVENGNGGGTVLFGDTVTCTAAAKDGSGKPFKYWKKSNLDGDEIVSVDKTYSFKAWEDCTVTAVYEEHIYFGESMKIIIDSFAVGNDTGVMAEFIGLDDAVEKGIMFTETGKEAINIAMTTKDSQFTVTADKPGTYVGYAILKSGDNAFTLITDGSYPATEE